MARPSQDAIDTFVSITGASESLALRKLEEHGGNLDEAINAHFGEVDRHITNPASAAPQPYNVMDMNDQSQARPRGLLPLLAAARSFKPSLLLDPNYRRDIYNSIGASAFGSRGPYNSLPREAGAVPQQLNSGNEHPHHSGLRQTEDLTGTSLSHGAETYGNAEEEMIQAAIEASRQEAERSYLNQQYSASNDSPGTGLLQRQHHPEDDDFCHALSLSLKTAEQENAMREQQVKNEDRGAGSHDLIGRNEKAKNSGWKQGSSSHPDGAENRKEHSTDAFHTEEWGGMSSEELDEAVMIETALFGAIPGGTSNHAQHAPSLQSGQDRSFRSHSVPYPPLPSPTAQQSLSLREQQYNEYPASVLSDKEKEINALKETETHQFKEDKFCNKLLEGEELERMLAAKEASLPKEPAIGDENAVTLLVRMPDGSRHGRRFLKSDKLQILFNFIDVSRVVRPGTYKVVRPYPGVLSAFVTVH